MNEYGASLANDGGVLVVGPGRLGYTLEGHRIVVFEREGAIGMKTWRLNLIQP